MSDIDHSKLGKIVALAKRGVGGEKATAIKLVKKLCAKHGLSFEEVMGDDEVIREYVIKYKTKEEERLIHQIVCIFANDRDPDIDTWGNSFRKVVIFKTTHEKYIEVLNAVSLLIPAFKKEKRKAKEAVYYGFLEKHDLYSNPSKQKSKKGDDISKEELMLRRMGSGMSDGMDDVHIRKQITSGAR